MNKKRRRRPLNLRRYARQLNSDDGVDPRTWFKDASNRTNRKDLQLCKQVRRTIELTLGDFGDEVLGGLLVESVMPAPNASQLLVTVRPITSEDTADVGDVLGRLERISGALRTEIARSINRKKTPRLMFQVAAIVPPPGEDQREGK